eukprot:766385-Hanusia_phi.AAC.1
MDNLLKWKQRTPGSDRVNPAAGAPGPDPSQFIEEFLGTGPGTYAFLWFNGHESLRSCGWQVKKRMTPGTVGPPGPTVEPHWHGPPCNRIGRGVQVCSSPDHESHHPLEGPRKRGWRCSAGVVGGANLGREILTRE